jgi:hypothetical protein
MEQEILKTLEEVKNIMTSDNTNEETKKAVTEIIKIILNSNTYINSIKDQVKTIIEDKKIDEKDIPTILTIVLQSKLMIREIIMSSSIITININMDTTKYIIYSIIHFILVVEKVNLETIYSFNKNFSLLWKLVAFEPKELVTNIKKITNKCFPCFSKKN